MSLFSRLKNLFKARGKTLTETLPPAIMVNPEKLRAEIRVKMCIEEALASDKWFFSCGRRIDVVDPYRDPFEIKYGLVEIKWCDIYDRATLFVAGQQMSYHLTNPEIERCVTIAVERMKEAKTLLAAQKILLEGT